MSTIFLKRLFLNLLLFISKSLQMDFVAFLNLYMHVVLQQGKEHDNKEYYCWLKYTKSNKVTRKGFNKQESDYFEELS